jgi:hypothetical protein
VFRPRFFMLRDVVHCLGESSVDKELVAYIGNMPSSHGWHTRRCSDEAGGN